jgi:hypothetical protein
VARGGRRNRARCRGQDGARAGAGRDTATLARLAPEARNKVLTLDLRAQGITDYGDPKGGFSMDADPGLELFVDDAPMSLSRYPNEGFIRITEVLGKTPVDVRGTIGAKEGVFRVEDPRIARWVGEKDPRVLGYWFWDWADERQKVASVDAATGRSRCANPGMAPGTARGSIFMRSTC